MENRICNSKANKSVIINHNYLDVTNSELLIPDALKPQVEKYQYNRIIYLKSTDTIILDIISSNKIHNLKEDYFTDCLYTLPYFNYESLLFFSTICFKQMNLNKSIDFDKKFNDAYFNELLNTTFGYIVYNHQLEHLYYMITGSSTEDAVLFRKNWNKKKNRDDAKWISINSSLSLYDLLIDRCFDDNQFVYTPKFTAAYSLWNEFKNINQI